MPTIALFIWPIVALGLFSWMGLTRGFIAAAIWGYLYLPERFSIDLPGLPGYDKNAAVALGIVLGVVFFRRAPGPSTAGARRGTASSGRLRTDFVFIILMILFFVGPFLTYFYNRSTIRIVDTVLPPIRPWDLISITFNNLVMLVPYLVARRYLNTPDAHRKLLITLVWAGIIYSLLVVFERRMSPQLHTWIYGYFQHSFIQHIRGGGFRPIVFLRHGLWVGFFMFSVVIAAFVLYKDKGLSRQGRMIFVAIWLFCVLAISRNLAALSLALLLVPVILLIVPQLQARIAAIIAILFLAYPVVRQNDLVPIDRILSIAGTISVERMESLQTRINNEDLLLDRASRKPAFGWGGWGRWRIYDRETGEDITISDGTWVIKLGSEGWVGYIGFFGLLTMPMILLGGKKRRAATEPATAGMMIIMAGNLIYLIPNSALSPIGWMIAGALAGYARQPVAKQDKTAPVQEEVYQSKATARRQSPYSRGKVFHVRGR